MLFPLLRAPAVVHAALEQGWRLTSAVPTERCDSAGPVYGQCFSLVRVHGQQQQALTYEVDSFGRMYQHATVVDTTFDAGSPRFALTEEEVLALLPRGARLPNAVAVRDSSRLHG